MSLHKKVLFIALMCMVALLQSAEAKKYSFNNEIKYDFVAIIPTEAVELGKVPLYFLVHKKEVVHFFFSLYTKDRGYLLAVTDGHRYEYMSPKESAESIKIAQQNGLLVSPLPSSAIPWYEQNYLVWVIALLCYLLYLFIANWRRYHVVGFSLFAIGIAIGVLYLFYDSYPALGPKQRFQHKEYNARLCFLEEGNEERCFSKIPSVLPRLSLEDKQVLVANMRHNLQKTGGLLKDIKITYQKIKQSKRFSSLYYVMATEIYTFTSGKQFRMNAVYYSTDKGRNWLVLPLLNERKTFTLFGS